MVNYFIYAKDFSGSTGGDKHFHSNGIKTVDQFKRDAENIKEELLTAGDLTESKIIYLHWGSRCFEVDEEVTRIAYEKLESGNMGTDPETIIEWIQQNINRDGKNIKLLYIITDGLISPSNVEKCFNLNENMHYEKFVFHGINENVNYVNISVAASFLKGRCLIYRNNELYDDVNVSEEFDYDKINVDNFDAEKENLKPYIKLKYIGKFKRDGHALQEIEKLKKLRNRLFEELSSKVDNTDYVDLDVKEKNEFIRAFHDTKWYKNLHGTSQDLKVDIEKSISTLINYIVSDTKSYAFDALTFDVKFNNSVNVEPIIDVTFTPEQEIEFPDIILDDDKGIPVIILATFNLLDKIIFHKGKGTDDVSPASFNKFKSAMDCPLSLLNDTDISESIGYFYTLNVYKQLLSNGTKTEPRTRRSFHGGLVLTDTNDFDKYNDYILSATYFDSRKVYFNIGLFYYVLWKNCENKEWMDRNVVERFEKYVMRRISETKCKIGLSSLPLDPPDITSLPTALWYCVEMSSIIFKNDRAHFMQERLRMFASVAESMIEILTYFRYPLELETIKKRLEIIRYVTILKRIPQYKEKVYYLLERIFKNDNGLLICEIEKPFNLYKLNYLRYKHKEMLDEDVIEDKVDLNEYVHLMHYVDSLTTVAVPNGTKDQFEICDKTFRPYFTIDENKSFYTELVKTTKKVIINNDAGNDKIKITHVETDSLDFDKILSLFNLFLNCVKDSGKYPTLLEYAEYISKKKKFKHDLVTIYPINTYWSIETVYSRYENITKKVDVNEFIEVIKNYVHRPERIKAENILKFEDNKEISMFISKQEAKVNLKKKERSNSEG